MAYRIDIPWDPPRARPLDIPFRAHYAIHAQSGDYAPDERMIAMWEKYRREHAAYVPEFARRLVALFRGVTWLPRDGYSADWPTTDILALTKQAVVVVDRFEFQGEKYYSLAVQFDLEWDEEHGPARLPFDEETETFGDWEG